MEATPSTGIEPRRARSPLIGASGMSFDKLPMLRLIFERFATSCTQALCAAGPAGVEVAVESLGTCRMEELPGSEETGASFAIYHAPKWDARVIAGFDRGLLFTVLSALFGADGSEAADTDERALSRVDLAVANWTFGEIAGALQGAFAPLAETPFLLEKVEPRLDPQAVGRGGSALVTARFAVQSPVGAGSLFVAIPQAALSPMRASLAQAETEQPAAPDPVWLQRLGNQVKRADVKMRALLGSRQLTLGDIADLKPGQLIELERASRYRVRVECNDQPLFWCHLGQADGAYTLRIDDYVDHEQEFMDDILPC